MQDLLRRPVGYEQSLVQGHEPVRHRGDQGHVVLDHEEGRAQFVAQPQQERDQGL